MEKILLIGKSGNEMKQLNEYFHDCFRIMSCTETTQNAPAMLKVVEPDLVLAVLSGVYDVDMSIFDILCTRSLPSAKRENSPTSLRITRAYSKT